jgi:hypothetical protein
MPRGRAAYNRAATQYIGSLIIPDENDEDNARLNGRLVPQLDLFSTHPYLNYAHTVMNINPNMPKHLLDGQVRGVAEVFSEYRCRNCTV